MDCQTSNKLSVPSEPAELNSDGKSTFGETLVEIIMKTGVCIFHTIGEIETRATGSRREISTMLEVVRFKVGQATAKITVVNCTFLR